MSAMLVSAVLLFASSNAGFVSSAFAQTQETQQTPQATNNGITTMPPPQVQPVNQTEAEEILDNLYQARQAVVFGDEVEALRHLDNIEDALTGRDVLVSLLVIPRNDTSAANATGTGNNTTGSFVGDTTAPQEAENTEIQNNNNAEPSSEEPLSILPSNAPSDAARIIPVQQQVQQQNTTAAQGQDTRTFRVTFERMDINVDHDPVFEGEWLMDVYVNQQRLPLIPSSVSLGSGDTYTFDQNNQVTVTVPAETGHIWITTAGWENDVGFEPLPNLLPILTIAEVPPEEDVEEEDVFIDGVDPQDTIGPIMTFGEYTTAIQGTIAEQTAGLANDPQGVVKKAFYPNDNFGIGQHSDCSEPNQFAVDDIQMYYEQTCDFVLHWSIEEVQQ